MIDHPPASHPTPWPWLVADIGGTHARFGLVASADGLVRDIQVFDETHYDSLQDAALAYLNGRRVHRAAVAIAAPLQPGPFPLTNSHWVVSRADLAVALALPVQDLRLLNDFEALALSLPGLQESGLRRFGGGVEAPGQPKAVIGPGTGLGVAACVAHGAHWIAVPAEGGHVSVAPADAFEDALVQALRPAHPHLSAEDLLSGRGLPTLHRGICQVMGLPLETLTAAEITSRGAAGMDEGTRITLDTFCAMLGSFAGNVALTLGARGGLYLAGGVTAVLADVLVASRFRERFEAKGRFRPYMSAIPTTLITAPAAALEGASAALANPNEQVLAQ